MDVKEIIVYVKIGEETGRKLYSCDKLIWFALVSNAVGVYEDREASALQVAEDIQTRKELLG